MNKSYDFSDLVLLIGTNPLPNFVVAKYFIENNPSLKRIWMIISDGTPMQPSTEKLADNLRAVLTEINDKIKFPKTFSITDIGDAESIYDTVVKMHQAIIKSENLTKVHLNYTGGTKPMSVHVYRAIEEKFEEFGEFSYLDARDFKLKMDRQKSKTISELRKKVDISILELIKLHDCDEANDFKKNKKKTLATIKELEPAKKYLEALIGTENWQNKLLEFSTKGYQLKTIVEDMYANKKNSSWENRIQDYVDNEHILEAMRLIPEEYRLLQDDGKIVPKNGGDKKKKEKTADFFGGVWLEHYIYEFLNTKIIEMNEGKVVSQSIAIETDVSIKAENTQSKGFQIDVLMINGYQVCGISCTTAARQDICKGKSFEIIHRSQQFGGEEGKALLICFLSNELIEDFESDIKSHTSAESKFMVLGIDDLAPDRLWEKINEFIWGN